MKSAALSEYVSSTFKEQYMLYASVYDTLFSIASIARNLCADYLLARLYAILLSLA